MTFKDYLIGFLIILVLLLGFGTYYYRNISRVQDLTARFKDDTSKRELRESIEAMDSVERASDSIIASERGLRAKAEAEEAKRTEAFKSTINRQAGSITQLKALRQKQGITPDTLSQAIERTQDSTIQAQAAEIEALHTDQRLANESHTREKEAMDDKLDAQLEVSLKAITRVDVLETKVIRLERKLLGWKIGAAVLGGIIIYQEIRN